VPAGFVYVPAGPFLYGSREDDAIRRFFGAAPMHEVVAPAFLVGATEVTYGDWIAFLDDIGPEAAKRHAPFIETSATVHEGGAVELRTLPDGARELHIQPAAVAYHARAGSPIEYRERSTRQRQDWRRMPVSGISADDARAYTAWLARTGRVPRARLCSELEWERAARGVDGRSYPHGDQLLADDANIDVTYQQRAGAFGPDEVGSHPRSTSPFGLADTSGNVWELATTRSGTGIVTRGGCFYTDARIAHLANRQDIPPAMRHIQIGLRVCADI
jgi:formylglycine-generating enzyme required for sulfatase activity